jgi:hypothetical protein
MRAILLLFIIATVLLINTTLPRPQATEPLPPTLPPQCGQSCPTPDPDPRDLPPPPTLAPLCGRDCPTPDPNMPDNLPPPIKTQQGPLYLPLVAG